MYKNLDKIEIKCTFWYGPSGPDVNCYILEVPPLKKHPIQGFEFYEVFPSTMSTKIDETNVVLKNVPQDCDGDVDVCVVPTKPREFMFLNSVDTKRRWKLFKKRHPHTSVILCENEYSWKMMEAKGKDYFKRSVKAKEMFINCLSKYKINESKRNELVKEFGAVKFVRYNSESGRGKKILLDEIAYAGLGKIMDERERSQKHCNVM